MNSDQARTLQEAVDRYGLPSQILMVSEEVGELLSALGKHIRGRQEGTKEAIITELADVSIMVEQMALHFGYAEYIEERDRKIQRLKERLQNTEK